jgi:Leucine-rich repeat (LRR) protein
MEVTIRGLRNWYAKLSEHEKMLIEANFTINAIEEDFMRQKYARLGFSPFDLLEDDWRTRLPINDYVLNEIYGFKYFYGAECAVNDIGFMHVLENLEQIDLTCNYSSLDEPLIDLSPLSNCKQIKELCLDDNAHLSNIDVCSNFKDMSFFRASRCCIQDSRPLLNCKKIKYLNLSGNFETQYLEELAQSLKVHELQIANQGLTSIDFLKECPEIRVLDIGNNDIKDIKPVFELPKLKFLRICGNLFNQEEYDWTILRNRGVYLVKEMQRNGKHFDKVFFYKYKDVEDELDFMECYD